MLLRLRHPQTRGPHRHQGHTRYQLFSKCHGRDYTTGIVTIEVCAILQPAARRATPAPRPRPRGNPLLTILHLNDLHSRLTPLENKRGGFAYLATVIRRERANCKDCILLNAGDVAQGTPVSTIFHGLPVFEIVNLLGIDAATLGNHDFDYGWPQTRKFIATANYPIVSANVVGPKGHLFTKEPYVILNVNGLRVAVIGAMTKFWILSPRPNWSRSGTPCLWRRRFASTRRN